MTIQYYDLRIELSGRMRGGSVRGNANGTWTTKGTVKWSTGKKEIRFSAA